LLAQSTPPQAGNLSRARNNSPFEESEKISLFFNLDALHKLFFMIKLSLRESMKNVSRIFSAMVCSASLFAFQAYGAVATTSGSNLTAYNPSTARNNQWASMSNPRNDNVSAKADFGNCNAIVLRCAQPKCANGGCGEMDVAAGIVAGCVKSNDKCKQYGDDLINFMTAQLVASSQSKINASNAEQIQAAQDAAQQAQMAAQQAAAQSAQQMAEMQSNMQQQMMQMQQQMAEQNAQSAQQIADALATSQRQQQQAISDMRSAAESAAQVQASGAVITQEDKEAIERGVSEDVLKRATVTGQIVTELGDAKTALTEVKVALDKAFIEYSGCDSRGNNCAGPKRVKKWRELAGAFIEPYDKVVEKISDALDVAQVVGVDLSDIYMMLNNSCNSWGQYMCPGGGTITYDTDPKTGQKGAPTVCTNLLGVDNSVYNNCLMDCKMQNAKENFNKSTQFNVNTTGSNFMKKNSLLGGSSSDTGFEVDKAMLETAKTETDCATMCAPFKGDLKVTPNCKPCTLLKLLPDKEEVYDMWVNTEGKSQTNQVIVACASSAMKTGLLARQAKRKSGAGVLDLDILDEWIKTYESSAAKENIDPSDNKEYCSNATEKADFVKALNSKTISPKTLCKTYTEADGYCEGIKPEFAICDTHAWNAGLEAPLTDTNDIETVRGVIGKKVTLIAQQAYKQYDYLAATLRRLETSLKKSVLSAQLEKAGATTNSSGSSGGGSSRNTDNTIVLAGAENCSNKNSLDSMYSCLQNNANLVITAASTNAVKACKQLKETLNAARTAFEAKTNGDISSVCENIDTSCNKNTAVSCAQQLNFKVMQKLDDQKQKNQGLQFLLGATK
jgi:hypothetical protein